jgi:trk system potassium uptake protein TrkH
MLRLFDLDDLKIIIFYTGKIIILIGLLMLIPFFVGLAFAEWPAAVDFLFSTALTLSLGYIFLLAGGRTDKIPKLFHAMLITALSWLIAMAVSAVPYFLSGHMASFLDACYDTMSGYTTTGLYLLKDLDHISVALNMWRHIITYTGGQGIVVLALTFLITPTSGAYKIMVGEGKEVQLQPNVRNTAIQIWKISSIYLIIGTLVLSIVGYSNGIKPVMALMNGIWIFMSAWSTGGFAPYSQNILYYHSFAFDIISMIIFILGSMNFAIHNAIWTGNRKEIWKNIEMKSFTITLSIISFIAITGLAYKKVYTNILSFFNLGFYQIVSAHTTTGLSTIYSVTFIKDWGPPGMIAIILAMAIGGSAASTAGGFKGLRVGIIFKGMIHEIKTFLTPEKAVISTKIHHIRDTILDDSMVKSAALIIIFYVFTYMLGAVVGTAYGYPFIQAFFESVSNASNTGLSVGITNYTMPTAMKVVGIFQMWLGRLEFISVFVFFGSIIMAIFRKRVRIKS